MPSRSRPRVLDWNAPVDLRRRRPKRRPPALRRRALSRGECEALTMLEQDLTQKEIGIALGVSVSTVNTLIQRAHQKYGVQGPILAVLLHQQLHAWCGTRDDLGPILDAVKAARRPVVQPVNMAREIPTAMTG